MVEQARQQPSRIDLLFSKNPVRSTKEAMRRWVENVGAAWTLEGVQRELEFYEQSGISMSETTRLRLDKTRRHAIVTLVENGGVNVHDIGGIDLKPH